MSLYPRGLKEDFELVVGRRQVAAFAFLALVLVAVCSGASYLAGKAISARAEPAEPEIQIEEPPAPAASTPTLHRCPTSRLR